MKGAPGIAPHSVEEADQLPFLVEAGGVSEYRVYLEVQGTEGTGARLVAALVALGYEQYQSKEGDLW